MATVGMDVGHAESTWERTGGKGVKTSLHPSGRFEEHWFNAEVSLLAKAILERHGVKVVMAQKPFDNNEVSLKARTDFYDAQNCDLIVSNHANASGNKTVDGFCVFYWHNSADAKRLAEIILKHSKVLPVEQFGTGVIASVPNTWTDFHMCREPKAVSPLLEWGFFTNEKDLKLLLDSEFRKQCAEVEAKAILEYLNIPYKAEVQKSSSPTPQAQKDSADGKLVRGEQGDNVRLMIDMLRELQHTRIVGDIFNGYIENALKEFQKSHGLPVDGVYTSKVGSAMLKAIQEKREAAKIKVDPIPEKSDHTYRLAKLYDTQSEDLVKKLKEEGYKVIDLPDENK